MDPEQVQAQQQSQSADPSASTAQASTTAESSEARETAEPSEAKAAVPALKTPEQIQAEVQATLDHVNAVQALAGKMEVVDPSVDPSQRKPNQVTAEQFNQLASQYAAIKRGETDVQFDTGGMKDKEADKFKDGAMGDIATMMQTESGRALLDGVSNNISPITGEHHTTTIGAAKEATAADTGWSGAEEAIHNGDGANADITYKPGESFMLQGQGVLENSNSALYHEMVHAYHIGRGDVPDGTVDKPIFDADKNVKAAEYQAVGLGGYDGKIDGVPVSENQYRSERRALNEDMKNRDSYNSDPQHELEKLTH